MGDLYHIEVYMPQEYIDSSLSSQRTLGTYKFSYHLKKRLFGDRDYKHALNNKALVQCINNLRSSPTVPFEIEVDDGEIVKLVVRVPYTEENDVSIAIQLNSSYGCPLIKTAWLNDRNDIHTTLDTTKYIQNKVEK